MLFSKSGFAQKIPSFFMGCLFYGILLSSGAFLFWYGICVNRIADGDLDFTLNHGSTSLFSTPWLWRGNVVYRVKFNPGAAIPFYREAVSRQVLNLDAWFLLAQVKLIGGDVQTARKIFQFLAKELLWVSTWKWNELLLAYDLREEAHFSHCFNFILSRLPHRIDDALYIASLFWGDPMQVIDHTDVENRTALFKIFITKKEIDPALALWRDFEKRRSIPETSLTLKFCQMLLERKQTEAAKKVWTAWLSGQPPGIYNGGFEQEPLRTSFGWRFSKSDHVEVKRTSSAPYRGKYALHLRFKGTANVASGQVSQIVPIEAGKTYRLLFARKAENLTTDQGVFIRVSGYECEGLDAQSRPVSKTASWEEEEIGFQVPNRCHAVLLQVAREPSKRINSKIAGDYWLDAVQLIPIEKGAS